MSRSTASISASACSTISRPTAARDLVMNSIAPIWDGNETWLVLGSLGLFAAFPLAFAIIIPAVYFPILLMLLALIFRGLAFEFRYRDAEHRTFWDHGFAIGSALATFAQGVVLGASSRASMSRGGSFVGSSFDCFTPFSVFTGLALMFGYALLGAGWLVIKTEGTLQDWARALGRRCLIGTVLAIARRQPVDTVRRSAYRGALVFLAEHRAPGAGAAHHRRPDLVCMAVARTAGRSYAPFIAALALFLMSYLGIAISLWPMIVPGISRSTGRGIAEHAGLPAGRHARSAAGDPALYGAGRTGCFAARCAPTSATTSSAATSWRCRSWTMTGSVNANVEPRPGFNSTQIFPPCISMMRFEIASPSPVPPFLRVIELSAC